MKHRLLIACRELEWRELYESYFTDLDYEVETSCDGLDCLAKLRQAAPAILVLDLELPWGGGDGILAWLREERSAPQIPVLLMGPTASNPTCPPCQESPVLDYLCKPVGLTRLLISVRSAFARTLRPEAIALKECAGDSPASAC